MARTAEAIGRRVGIDRVLAEVQKLQERFGLVAFVGDGSTIPGLDSGQRGHRHRHRH
jgi:cation transport ATPase